MSRITPRGDAAHHEDHASWFEPGESDGLEFAPEESPFVEVDHYSTCGHRLLCARCGNAHLVIVVVPGAYWTGALCEECGILADIHTG